MIVQSVSTKITDCRYMTPSSLVDKCQTARCQMPKHCDLNILITIRWGHLLSLEEDRLLVFSAAV